VDSHTAVWVLQRAATVGVYLLLSGASSSSPGDSGLPCDVAPPTEKAGRPKRRAEETLKGNAGGVGSYLLLRRVVGLRVGHRGCAAAREVPGVGGCGDVYVRRGLVCGVCVRRRL
jgi:hypothetical protein